MLTQFYPPFIGGEEQVVRNLSTELAARGHRVSVITIGTPELPVREVMDGVQVYRLRSTAQRMPGLYGANGRSHAPPLPDPELSIGIRQVVAHEKPQIVHAHNWLVHSFLPIKHWSGAKLALSLHDYSFVCATKKLLYEGELCDGPGPVKCLRCASAHYGRLKGSITAGANWGMNLVERRLVDLFLPVSLATVTGNQLDSLRLPYRIIPNFLPDTVAGTPTDSYVAQLPEGDFLLFAGALGAYKGVDVLLEAYSMLQSPPPLVLIGYDTAESPLRTTELPPGVRVLKNWPHAAVMEAWRRSTVAVVPSLVRETFGMVALEAMSAGRPVIASRIGGLPEVVRDGETGLLVEPGNARDLVQAIDCLLSDPALRDRMGAAALRHVEQYSAGVVVPCFEDTYREMLSPRPGNGGTQCD